MSSKICLFGAGGHGRVVAAQIKARWPHSELCFGDTHKPLGTCFNEIAVVVNTIETIRNTDVIVTIGDNILRETRQKQAIEQGLDVISFIADPDNYFAAQTGAGCMILAGAIVTSDVKIGQGVIINSGAIVEHDCEIGDFCHIAPGAILAGGATLGDGVFIGAGARVVNQARIAPACIIGAGATVTCDLTEAGTYVGTPARRIATPKA